jgi:predicted nucleic acid-binding protein
MLVDTSIWVDHFRHTDERLALLLERGDVECHPFILGELACGNLKQRAEIFRLLRRLPQIVPVDHDEALQFLESEHLAGTGLGWIDIHLLAAARLAQTTFWTRDRRAALLAQRLGLAP